METVQLRGDRVRLEPSVSSIPSPSAMCFGMDRILHIYHAGVECVFVILGLRKCGCVCV